MDDTKLCLINFQQAMVVLQPRGRFLTCFARCQGLERLYRTDLGPLQVSESRVFVGLFVGLLVVGWRPVHGLWDSFCKTVTYAEIPHHSLNSREGAWFCLNLICHVFLTLMGGLPISEWWLKGWQEVGGGRGMRTGKKGGKIVVSM